jgi:hypothetical protein
MRTRKPTHHARPGAEVLEPRALLSTLVVASTPHPVDAGAVEIRRLPHQQFQRARVRITNNTTYLGTGLAIEVTAQVFENSQPRGPSKTETIGFGKTGTFDFGHGPPGLGWEIRINVVRAQGSPPPYPSQGLSLVKNPNGGYHGKNFTITYNGTNFSVSL